MTRRSLLAFAAAIGCGPEVETVHGDHLDYAWEVGLDPCAGNAARMDRLVPFYAEPLDLDVVDLERVDYTWLTEEGYDAVAPLDRLARAEGFAHGDHAHGKSPTIDHEVVHTVVHQRGGSGTPFIEEGIAVAMDPPPNLDGPRHPRGDPRRFVDWRYHDEPGDDSPMYQNSGAFVSYPLSRRGPGKLLDLRDRLGRRSSGAEFARDFERVYGRPLADEVDEYLSLDACPEDASATPQLFACSAPTIPWVSEDRWVHVTAIDCDDLAFSGDREGRVFTEVTVAIPVDGVYRVSPFGDRFVSLLLAS